jgi:hypothetical protein
MSTNIAQLNDQTTETLKHIELAIINFSEHKAEFLCALFELSMLVNEDAHLKLNADEEQETNGIVITLLNSMYNIIKYANSESEMIVSRLSVQELLKREVNNRISNKK